MTGNIDERPPPMTPREAVMAFSQSEKIKAGLIWVSQAVDQSVTLPEATFHLTRALSRVTTIGQRAMTVLKQQGLI